MVKSKSNAPALSRFRILGSIYDEDDEISYYQIQYRTVDGESKKAQIKRAIFQRPSQAVDHLINLHADLPDDRASAIKVIERGIRDRRKKGWRITGRPGWYDQSFVYLTQTFGELNGKLRHRGSASIDPALGKQGGTLQTWKKGLRKPCRYSDFLVFSISLGSAGVLLDLINEDEGAIFHLHGRKKSSADQSLDKTQSTSGKSTAARCTASTMGSCRKNELVTFATTITAIEDYCSARNNLAAVFDEEGRALGIKSGPNVSSKDMPYLIPSGRGAVRSNKATQDPNLKNKTWSLFAISTGENPLDARREARTEGAQVRMISVPVPAGGRGGIYNRVDGSRSHVIKKARQLARKVEDTISANYGTAIPAFLAELVPRRAELAPRVGQIVDDFINDVHAGGDPWERRFAEKFGIVLAAAILMSEFEIGPWTKKRGRNAVTAIYKRARRSSVSTDKSADAFVKRLRKLVAAGKRFPKIKKKGQVLSQKAVAKAWGVLQKDANAGWLILVPYKRVEQLVNPSAITKQVLHALAARNLVLSSRNSNFTRQLMLKALTGSKRQGFVRFVKTKVMSHSSAPTRQIVLRS
jgi:hypothetical protein